MNPCSTTAALLRVLIRWLSAWGLRPATWPDRRRRVALVGRYGGRPARGVSTTATRLGGLPCERTEPADPRKDLAVLYLHGGGWTVGSARSYRGLAGRLARRMNATVWAPDYRLAPEDPFPAALEDCLTAYRALVDTGVPRIVVAGDSAGGGLAASLPSAAAAAGLPAPAAIGLICPAVDLTEETLDRLVDSPREPVLSRSVVHEMFDCYAGDHPRADPLLSPAYGDLRTLPPVVLDSSADDLLCEQDLAFASAVRDAGGTIDHVHHPGLWHVFQLLAGTWPVATRALDDFADRLARVAG